MQRGCPEGVPACCDLLLTLLARPQTARVKPFKRGEPHNRGKAPEAEPQTHGSEQPCSPTVLATFGRKSREARARERDSIGFRSALTDGNMQLGGHDESSAFPLHSSGSDHSSPHRAARGHDMSSMRRGLAGVQNGSFPRTVVMAEEGVAEEEAALGPAYRTVNGIVFDSTSGVLVDASNVKSSFIVGASFPFPPRT